MRIIGITAVLLAIAGSATAQDKVAAGQKVFVDQKCSLCHSIAGKGNQKGALDDVGARLTADEIKAWLTDAKAMTAKTKATRKPDMRAYNLPQPEVEALVAYMQSLKKK